jgi:hypothetical protein
VDATKSQIHDHKTKEFPPERVFARSGAGRKPHLTKDEAREVKDKADPKSPPKPPRGSNR